MFEPNMSRQNPTESDSADDALSPRQETAAVYIANGFSVTQTATLVGVTRQTVSDWWNANQPFMNRVAILQRQQADEEQIQISRLRRRAVEVIAESLDNEGPERLAAAKLLLQLPIPKIMEVERRVAVSRDEFTGFETILSMVNRPPSGSFR